MPICEILTIGSELMSGKTLNTNSQFLSKEISDLNIDVAFHTSCRDLEPDVLEVLELAYRRSDLIFVVGGLGPTPDDITRDVVARFFRCGLAFDRQQYARIVAYFKERARRVPLVTRREASFPTVATPLVNRFGLALGFSVWQDKKLLIALPGVPKELTGMFQASVLPLIKQKFKHRRPWQVVEARVVGLYETEVMGKLGRSFFKGRLFDFGIYPEVGEVLIRVKTHDKKLAALLKRELARKLRGALYGFGAVTLPGAIGKKLVAQKQTISVAESCTGGWLAKRLTDPPGASRYFQGASVAYSNRIKTKLLGVSDELPRSYGAVSGEVARAMAIGARTCYGTSLAVSITGIAGPSGGSVRKPVGLVHFGLSDRVRTRTFQFRFSGDRRTIRLAATQKALELIWKWLEKP